MLHKLLIFSLVFVAIPANTIGENHLVPEQSLLTDPFLVEYQTLVAQTFQKLPESTLGVAVIPSFRNEFAITMQLSDASCHISYSVTEHHLWAFILRSEAEDEELGDFSSLPDDPNSVSLTTQSKNLPNDICSRIEDVWRAVLLETKYPDLEEEPIIGLDGTDYHFWIWIRGAGTVSGTTWSPDNDTVPGLLVRLSHALGKIALGKADSEKTGMLQYLEQLEQHYR